MDISNLGARWVEVDLDVIKHNYEQIRELVPRPVKMLGVVKADAYGHGAVEVARVLEKLGIDMLGVTTAEEGKELREAGVTAPILVFGPFLKEDVNTIIDYCLTATIGNRESVQWLQDGLAQRGGTVKVHLKVETGMGRTGFWPRDALQVISEISAVSGLYLEGIYSHLATAMWKNKRYAQEQYTIFKNVLDNLARENINIPIKHLANSAAVLDLPHMQLDMVRVGTLLYGQYPAPELEKKIKLKDPWSLKAKVIYLRNLPAGHSVGYGRTYKARRETKVAILPLGFVDGLQTEPVQKPANILDLLKGIAKLVLHYLGHPLVSQPVIFPGGRGRIIGKVGMQLSMVDVTTLKGIEVGTVATVPARRTAIRPTLPVVYREEGRVKSFKVTSAAIWEKETAVKEQ
jgi:alanine racemase